MATTCHLQLDRLLGVIVSLVQRDELDRAMRIALYGAAGELQREIADVGPERVSESDLRLAMRRALQAQLGPTVRAEWPVTTTSQWSGRLGAFDIGVGADQQLAGAAELKWCRDESKLSEALWDALKLLPFAGAGAHELLGVYLVFAAPATAWASGSQPVMLFEAAIHNVSTLLATYEKQWSWLLKGNRSARPVELSSEFKTEALGCVQLISAEHPTWEIRCARVLADTPDRVRLEDGWPVSAAPAKPFTP